MKLKHPILAIVNARDLTVDEIVHRAVLCPACREKVFEKWPEGWDAHAAHKCNRIEGNTPEERKKNYKAKYKHMFR